MKVPVHKRAQHERRLFAHHLAEPGPASRDVLVRHFLPLADHVAQRFRNRADSYDDLRQVASIGLIKAIDRFDPERGVAFSTYAVPTISGELKRYLRDKTWSVRPPRDLQDRVLRVQKIADRLTTDLGRAPTVGQIAAAAGDLEDEDVLEALYAARGQSALSLDTPLGGDTDDEQAALIDTLGRLDDDLLAAEQRALLRRLMRAVPERDRSIVAMRYLQDMTQAEIGAAMGISQMQVSRLLARSLERMRILGDADPDPDSDETPAPA